MSNHHLSVYLNDHLAGSTAAMALLSELELLDGLRDQVRHLRTEIATDREQLERLMRDAGVAKSPARRTVAWLTARLADLKIRVDDQSSGPLRRLELVEALALGIDGKRALWTALQAAAARRPALQILDYARLIARAEDQRRIVEQWRLEAAAEALNSPDSSEAIGATKTALMVGGLAVGAAIMAKALRARRAIDFTGRVALITGGSRGLGLLIAREVGRLGGRVVLVARDETELRRAQVDLESRGVATSILVADIGEPSEAERVVAETMARHGRVDVLFNNAGVIKVGPLDHMTFHDFEEAMAVHFWGPLCTMRVAIPHMRRLGGGRIVNISSIGGKIGVPHLVPYCASKFALTGLSTAARAELAGDGILITTVSPGLMRTGSPFNAWFKGRHRQEFAWFAISDSLPLFTISARRAAAQIVDAARHGDPELIVAWPARLAVLANAIAPNATARALQVANRVLPAPSDSSDTDSYSGWQSGSVWAPSFLTRSSERSAAENNELPVE